jgi:hypothetical protein
VVFASFATGATDADAPPTSEKVNPAAPNTGAAALAKRLLFEACFTCGIVPPYLVKECFDFCTMIVSLANPPCKAGYAFGRSRFQDFMKMNKRSVRFKLLDPHLPNISWTRKSRTIEGQEGLKLLSSFVC